MNIEHAYAVCESHSLDCRIIIYNYLDKLHLTSEFHKLCTWLLHISQIKINVYERTTKMASLVNFQRTFQWKMAWKSCSIENSIFFFTRHLFYINSKYSAVNRHRNIKHHIQIFHLAVMCFDFWLFATIQPIRKF